MKFLPFLLSAVVVQSSFAQQSKENYTSELVVSLVEYSMYPKIKKTNYEFIPNIGYIHYFRKWNLTIQAGFISRSVESGCKTCPDAYYGTINDISYHIKSSINRRFFSFSKSKFTCFGGLGIYLAKSELSGNLDGGFDGSGRMVNSVYTGYGVRPQLLLSFFPVKRLGMSVLIGQRFGIVKMYDKEYNYTGKMNEHTWFDPELRISFRF